MICLRLSSCSYMYPRHFGSHFTNQHKSEELHKMTDSDSIKLAPTDIAVFEVDATAGGDAVTAISHSHRGLRPRHLQLIAISGAIGSSVFISIGGPLTGGPLALLIGVSLWATVVWAISNFLVEMSTLLPIDGGFVHYSSRFLDQSIGFALGWNYFVTQVALIATELTSFNVLVAYWAPDLHPAICISVGLVLLLVVQVVNVRVYGETEFWISIFKVFLIVGMFIFTIVTMLGGNPLHDRYGFRFWKDPGPFAASTPTGRAYDIWHAVQWGAYGIVGPDYIALVGGEVKDPRRVLPKAFKSTIYRIIAFYVGGALFVGINAPYNDDNLLNASSKTARSPYVINMNRLGIPVLPDILTAGILLSLFSSGSSMAFAASRTLYGLGLQGQAPKFVTKVNKHGLPYICVLITLALSCLSYLAVSNGTNTVLTWLINLTTATQLITWMVVAASYLRFRAGLVAQGIGLDFLPARGFIPRFSAWYTLVWSAFALIFSGYTFFGPGEFVVTDFIFTYGAVFIFICCYAGWKLKDFLRNGSITWGVEAKDMDFKSDIEEIDAITLAAEEKRATKPLSKFQHVTRRVFRAPS
ncbi:hypothetical protein, variant 1 [Cryptococcus amylolentus CBS 6039]|uniref:Amino acid permease/ SLC12A domain-containing protein n=1 Tax=Cryptococcus amylolentus CBS 6039 TaxID=1295533 RepID=A0A1E3HAU2_9TREE|nr:hypothetical protein, variant 1 [Cryptococcus amylolentus CBS 6039]ODN72876.1 hypothetical protein, variant 1 [Cryptococcus amylolentus CBS 6039]